MMVTEEMKGFLDMFKSPEDNSHISCVLLLLMAINIIVVVVLWECPYPPFISKG
jgi:hypothetical protein